MDDNPLEFINVCYEGRMKGTAESRRDGGRAKILIVNFTYTIILRGVSPRVYACGEFHKFGIKVK